ncbi:MAG: PilZ domain-containing protein [Thermodesulfobacteriota bacterium]|nr:PilZ domain-containing protein [Thermodesulfobacteriota bacterium]
MAEKVFVAENHMAVFECPQCKIAKRVDVSKYKDIHQVVRIKVKCPCGHSYKVVLERRKYFRKDVNFPGTYTHVLPDYREDKGAMTVKNLSRAGVKIKLNAEKDFKIGDILTVEFRLNDQQRSFIKKKVVIKKISDLYLGVEFGSVDSSDPSDKAIGFYMFN